jgi:hypothetical protein
MSEQDETASPAPTPDQANEIAEVEQILRALMPQAGEKVVFCDRWGTEYRVPPLASLEQQVALKDTLSEALGLGGDTDGSLRGMATSLINTLTSPEFANHLEKAFLILHEDLVDDMRTEIPEKYRGRPARSLFPGEEMAKAVVPFCARPVLELLATAGPVIEKL